MICCSWHPVVGMVRWDINFTQLADFLLWISSSESLSLPLLPPTRCHWARRHHWTLPGYSDLMVQQLEAQSAPGRSAGLAWAKPVEDIGGIVYLKMWLFSRSIFVYLGFLFYTFKFALLCSCILKEETKGKTTKQIFNPEHHSPQTNKEKNISWCLCQQKGSV